VLELAPRRIEAPRIVINSKSTALRGEGRGGNVGVGQAALHGAMNAGLQERNLGLAVE
jgi:hypothetical protein